ncbi:ketopantoate reductase family protein [Pseudidiomarina homiensis]|uniref:2-dehydropantoate 2-reductase n=1 Tax=Pseudidiomarina homiensis TaxID=364198 RepID=A0A432Y4V8_9GAMM|nr:ketopantoate reductase family protein [Pseudidiomarina homiensis]RUO55994.1 hypothetical protein CWI70_04260 [Pseudidiomarina homiensis]
MTSKLPWCVIGQGALGSLMAVHLAQQNEQVQLKLRRTGSTEIRFDGQTFRFQSNVQLLQPSLIFAAVKAYQVVPLIEELRRYEAFAESTLILSYNGMLANEEEWLRPQDWHWVTTHGAYRDGAEVVHGGHGQSWLGTMTGTAEKPEFFTALARALPPLHWQADLRVRRWQKLAINCLINPYTVLHRCRNGELPQHVAPAEWRSVAEEIVRLAAYQGVTLATDDLLTQAQQVVEQTARNRSSMLQDYLHQRPMEIAYLNGFVAAASAAAGWIAPTNQRLSEQVQSLSSMKSTTSKPNPDNAE